MGKRAALLLTGALVVMDRLEGKEWGHQGRTGDSRWDPLESACTGLLEHSRQTPGMMGVLNTRLKSTLYDLLFVVLSGGWFTLETSLDTLDQVVSPYLENGVLEINFCRQKLSSAGTTTSPVTFSRVCCRLWFRMSNSEASSRDNFFSCLFSSRSSIITLKW